MLDQIGPYIIQREIGRGGMGVVYLARDARLERDVAIKALPEELAQDPVRLDRFEREAKAIAGLSHQNIAGIYGIEEQDGAKYLILEYIDGLTLADRLDAGQLPIEDALEIAVQIAAGVEAAHEAGIIHRDLKPENIKIDSDGVVKVLDFGLAKSDDGQSTSSVQLDAATLTQHNPRHSPTIAGAILGTAAYMSPEQARGRRVDKRTDIWAFGVLLYEMLVGSNPFHGESATDSIGAVLHKEFSLNPLPTKTPASVRKLIRRCLERNKTKRLQSIGDARVELQEVHQRMESGIWEPDDRFQELRSRRWLWPVVAGVSGIAAITGFFWPRDASEIPERPQVVGLFKLTDFQGLENSPSLSPDGKTLLYWAIDGSDGDIYRLRVGGQNPINLTADSDEHDTDPAFSPDGEQIAFASTRMGGGIFIMGATGENPKRVSDAGYNPAWSPDGQSIVYTSSRVESAYGRNNIAQLWRLDLETRERRQLDTGIPGDPDSLESPDSDAVEPAWSPDGSRIAYWTVRSGQRDICTISADGGDRVQLTDDRATDWNPIWIDGGSAIVYLSDRGGQMGLWTIDIDETGHAASDPHPFMPSTAQVVQVAASYDGSRLVIADQRTRDSIQMVRFDPATEKFIGKPKVIYSTSGSINQPDLSQDGEWIAYRDGPPSEDIYVMKTDGSSRRRLTDSPHKDRGPVWMPDAQSLLYYSNKDGGYNIFEIRRDGTGDQVLIEMQGTEQIFTPRPSNSGTKMIAITYAGSVLFERTEGEFRQDHSFPKEVFVGAASWSPDDRQLIGGDLRKSGIYAVILYNIENQTSTIPRWPDGEPIHNTFTAWIDSDRFIGWELRRQAVYIYNTKTNTIKVIESPFEGQQLFMPAKQGTEIYVLRSELERELWLLELGKN
jgi:eukaryotic-like serine/threonine-protein kinase